MILTPERARRLDRLSGDDGIVVGIAIDHRDSLQAVLRKRGVEWDAEAISEFKQLVARELAPAATVMLLDVESAAAQALASGALPGTTALALPLEAQGYEQLGGGPRTSLLEDWDAARSARLGADANKLLLPFRTDRPDHADAQATLAALAAREIHAAGLALILEPIVFAEDGELPAGDQFAELVIAGARRLAAVGPDILKVQYPGSPEACAELSEACGDVPWVLLGGGATAEALEQQVGDACRAGASGFIVGRTLFNDALVDDADEARRVLREQSLPLLRRLGETARGEASSWRSRAAAVPSPALGWHRPVPA
jgi:tagatose-1,6-bisphosphate aldolase